mmetsp:Transcript_20378/g.56475  ORF Transcript_20378/g.56475 Transcript_20378/m.56475 type:complete len:210 (+) Transcript_20378:1007-1636(+)
MHTVGPLWRWDIPFPLWMRPLRGSVMALALSILAGVWVAADAGKLRQVPLSRQGRCIVLVIIPHTPRALERQLLNVLLPPEPETSLPVTGSRAHRHQAVRFRQPGAIRQLQLRFHRDGHTARAQHAGGSGLYIFLLHPVGISWFTVFHATCWGAMQRHTLGLRHIFLAVNALRDFRAAMHGRPPLHSGISGAAAVLRKVMLAQGHSLPC